MKIAVGCDHGGIGLKELAKTILSKRGIEVLDMGTNGNNSVDYPDFAEKVANSVASQECDLGILVCGTGIGMSIAANKVQGIRAALCTDVFSAIMSREHNDANILCLGERVTGAGLAGMIIESWLEAGFEGGRHANRVKKIMDIEKEDKL